MIPLSTLRTRIRARYETESGGSTVRFSDANITAFVNEGLEDLAEETGFYERYCSVPVETDRVYYDLRGYTVEIPTNIKSIWSSVRNDYLVQTNPETLGSSWEQDTAGTPVRFWTRGVFWFSIYPVSNATTGYLRVKFAGIPPRFTFAQQVLYDLPDRYYPALEDYCLYEMAGADRQPKRAISYYQSYLGRQKSLHDLVDRRLVESTGGCFGRYRRRR
jgi:hypothetical protein